MKLSGFVCREKFGESIRELGRQSLILQVEELLGRPWRCLSKDAEPLARQKWESTNEKRHSYSKL